KLGPGDLGVACDEPLPMGCLPRKIPVPQTGGIARRPFVVTPSNLDPNGHLTSCVYFAIAQDALPENFAFNRVRAEFKRQASPGETLHIDAFPADDTRCTVDVRGEDGLSCAVLEFSAF
ncbi:MAG: hotdog fold thioesterase, partial [Victivallaceae bacterium]|nr:hotdog fold thioesterase [Victivallaceae bacterium]